MIAERLAAGAPENVQFARDLRFSYDYLGHKERALGNSQAALARYQQSLAITERLASRPPQDDQDASNLSNRYRKLGVIFLFNSVAKAYHEDGASWKEIVSKVPASSEAVEAQKRWDALTQKMMK